MASFVAGSAGLGGAFLWDDQRLAGASYRQIGVIHDDQDPIAPASFKTEWWPGAGASVLHDDRSPYDPGRYALRWGPYEQSGPAGASRYGFVGVTRNSDGTPVGNCVVKLFRTSDDLLIDKTVSDPRGNYLLNTPFYPDQHYIVAHKTDAPPINGASVNTLIGT